MGDQVTPEFRMLSLAMALPGFNAIALADSPGNELRIAGNRVQTMGDIDLAQSGSGAGAQQRSATVDATGVSCWELGKRVLQAHAVISRSQ
jgi:hypothetical protein